MLLTPTENRRNEVEKKIPCIKKVKTNVKPYRTQRQKKNEFSEGENTFHSNILLIDFFKHDKKVERNLGNSR